MGNDSSLASVFARQKVSVTETKQEKHTMHSFKREKNGVRRSSAGRAVRRSVYSQKTTYITLKDSDGACNSAKSKCGPKLYSESFRSRRCLWNECARRAGPLLDPQPFQDSRHHRPTGWADFTRRKVSFVAASIELAFLLRQRDNFPAVGFFEGFSSTFLKDEIKQLVNKIE